MASTASSYTLTFIEGTADEYVTHQMLPNFAKFNFPSYKFMPETKNDIGIFVI